jgi:signal transduction histidine kinase
MMIGGIAFLVAFYYDVRIAVASFLLVQVTELLDWRIFKRILSESNFPPLQTKWILRFLYANTALSAGAIGVFAVLIAQLQGHTTHFMPLFVVFAAALFSAMHNHQIPQILILRLGIYCAAFIFIPVHDLWVVRPPILSELWLQLFVGSFVLYFIFDTARAHAKLYEENLQQLDALKVEAHRARMAATAKSEFLSVVSHELRTPLTSIKGVLDLIGSGVFGAPPDGMVPSLELARKNSHRLSDLINDLLDYQQIDSDKMAYEYELVDVDELVASVTDKIRPMAQSFQITIDVEILDPGNRVRADWKRLAQVLNNLLSNAIKFSMDAGRVQVTTETLDEKVRISVSDVGIGIPVGAEENLFEPFYQGDSSATRVASGTGLGLPISKKIVQGLGGSIEFVRHEGKGTTFFVEFDRYLQNGD